MSWRVKRFLKSLCPVSRGPVFVSQISPLSRTPLRIFFALFFRSPARIPSPVPPSRSRPMDVPAEPGDLGDELRHLEDFILDVFVLREPGDIFLDEPGVDVPRHEIRGVYHPL